MKQKKLSINSFSLSSLKKSKHRWKSCFYCTDKIADHLLPVCKPSSSIRETVNYITLHENLINKDKDSNDENDVILVLLENENIALFSG